MSRAIRLLKSRSIGSWLFSCGCEVAMPRKADFHDEVEGRHPADDDEGDVATNIVLMKRSMATAAVVLSLYSCLPSPYSSDQ